MGGHDSEITTLLVAAAVMKASPPHEGCGSTEGRLAGCRLDYGGPGLWSRACAPNPIRAIQQVSARGSGGPLDLFSNFCWKSSSPVVGAV